MQPSDVATGASEESLLVAPPPPLTPPGAGTFFVHALGHMCLDFGGQAYWAAGAPVTLYWCNGSVAQELDVQEVPNSDHDVTLHVGTGLDNNYCIGARGGQPVAGAVLEMQVCNASEAQEFALDGDTIIAGHRTGLTRYFSVITSPPRPIARELVAKPLNDVTNAKTPIVLGPRQLTQSEYFTFVPTDQSNRKPHSGFITPPTAGADFQAAVQSATWGTVIEVPDATIDMTGLLSTQIPGGVTLRGDRKLTGYGPLIEYRNNDKGWVFEIAGGDTRVTGIRFQGPAWGTDTTAALNGIVVHDGVTVTIDDNEFSQFTASAVNVKGAETEHIGVCPVTTSTTPRSTSVRISGNFLDHNVAVDQGYGVGVFYGGFPLVERNVAYLNRHTIAAAYDVGDGYVATDNFVLHQAPAYAHGFDKTANFDVHGSLSLNCADRAGGYAGDYVVIQYNTFLSNDRSNVKIRGESCRTGLVDGNIFGAGQAIVWGDIGIPPVDCYGVIAGAVVNLDTNGYAAIPPPHLNVTSNNAYGQPAPVGELAVGDFDGDGVDDIFTTTGTGWFYSSGGKSEWRWLRRASDMVQALRVGDLDGDGRSDVIRVNGRTLEVSWGGVSSWQTLTTTPGVLPIGSYAIGNFDGDRLHGDDIFATDGATWFVAKNGHNFVATQTSSFPASALHFGDFDNDGKTDVLAVTGSGWSYSSAAAGTWQAIAGAPSTSSVDGGIFTGDFDGDGRTDIGRYYYQADPAHPGSVIWKFDYSSNARAPFTSPRTTTSAAAWSGHFQDGPGVIWWDDVDEFELGTGTAPEVKLSRQKMK